MPKEKDSYLRLAEPYRETFKVKGSRFIASVRHAESAEEATAIHAEISKEFYDATHNCFAWIVEEDSLTAFRYSDDGEPNHTAGIPIYKAIESSGIVNIIIVVTRYFGGIKLGTGGLVRAYGGAASDALKNCKIEKVYKTELITFSVPFEHTSVIHKLIDDSGVKLIDSEYTDAIKFIVKIRLSQAESFRAKLVDSTRGQVSFD